MSTVEQGRRGEAAVAAFFVKEGYDVYMPTFGNAGADMIICRNGVLSRVEIKTTATKAPSGNYVAALRQVRPNRTGSVVKKFDSRNSDLLAIYVEPEDRVVIRESSTLNGRSTITV